MALFIRRRKLRIILLLSAVMARAAILAIRRARRFDVRGRNAFVTGGSRGLGLEIARVLVAKGAHVVVSGRDPLEIERALVELRAVARETRVGGVVCDLTDDAELERILKRVGATLGPVDILVNNAGMIQVGPLSSMTREDFEKSMKLHCFAPLHLMLGVRKDMASRGGGRIANVASVGGVVSVPHLLPYSVSKFALMGLSLGMHAEFASDKIVVTTVAPGLMRTGSPKKVIFKGQPEAEQTWFTIGDSLPLLSMSSRRAARRIVRAMEYGQAHLILGIPARIAALAQGIVPRGVAAVMALVNRWLPSAGSSRTARGDDAPSPLSPSLLTTLTERAAERNNET